MAITPENQQAIVEILCQLLLEAEDPRIRARAARSLGRLGDETAIAPLRQAVSQDRDVKVRLIAMDAMVLIAKPELLKTMTEAPKNQPTFNINQVGNINTGDVTIQRDQVGMQFNQAPEQTFEILLADYKGFVAELQQKHFPPANETEALQIIDAEFKAIEQTNKPRWQNFLSLKRLWNGGKKAAIKVGEHFAEQNPWGKGAVAFLEGVSEDVK